MHLHGLHAKGARLVKIDGPLFVGARALFVKGAGQAEQAVRLGLVAAGTDALDFFQHRCGIVFEKAPFRVAAVGLCLHGQIERRFDAAGIERFAGPFEKDARIFIAGADGGGIQ